MQPQVQAQVTNNNENENIYKIKQRKNKKNSNRNDRTNVRIGFWNVHGLKSKENDFWEYIRTFDRFGLTETWTEEKDWKKIENRLPDNYIWKHTPAKRYHKYGRATGGMLTGLKKNWKEEQINEEPQQNLQERRVIIGNKK